ncbi:RNA-binding S4 domain-containing protein [Candidatus Woesearchaeota archaeon]|nr:RNA-binding S4 domain-containing protein [Candidatus Woesearchaeota archaeon]
MKYIELNAFLKVKAIATTGGQSKNIIRSGEVFLNNQPETRNRKKLYPNDKVTYHDKTYVVTEDVCLME